MWPFASKTKDDYVLGLIRKERRALKEDQIEIRRSFITREYILCERGGSCCAMGHKRVKISLTDAEVHRIIDRNPHIIAYTLTAKSMERVDLGYGDKEDYEQEDPEDEKAELVTTDMITDMLEAEG